MTRNKKILLGLAMTIVIVGSLSAYFLLNTNEKKEISYSLYETKKSAPLNFSGKVIAQKTQTVTYDAKLGEISAINATNGSQVKAGDVLVTYTSEDNENTLAERRVMQAKYEQNIANLNDAIYTQQVNLDNAKYNGDEAAEQAAEGELKSLNASLTSYQDLLTDVNAQITTLENSKETVVTAEMNGMVTVDASAKNNSTLPVVTINSNEVMSEISVSEYDIEKIKDQQDVTISYANQDKQVSGKISYKGKAPKDPAASLTTYPVHISLGEAIPLGYSVKIAVPQDEIMIPATAIQLEGKEQKEQYVFVYNKGKAVKRKITATEVSEDSYKLEKGLTEGEKIIRNPDKGVKDNMEVNAS